ncbi:hypothetical protein PUN28_000124 [Cardiocondyla obscurior]|uniref:Uncharacterized protein n=1 Tax=Cardiocondyla obscurior TaxID=286306 RepID=A0AAW2GXW4_9HYME
MCLRPRRVHETREATLVGVRKFARDILEDIPGSLRNSFRFVKIYETATCSFFITRVSFTISIFFFFLKRSTKGDYEANRFSPVTSLLINIYQRSHSSSTKTRNILFKQHLKMCRRVNRGPANRS